MSQCLELMEGFAILPTLHDTFILIPKHIMCTPTLHYQTWELVLSVVDINPLDHQTKLDIAN